MIVVDASVAAAWFLPEAHSGFADELLRTASELVAPDLLVVEVGNALVKAHRRGTVRAERVTASIERLLLGLVTLHPTPPLLRAAAHLACARRCSIYDAAYVELARRLGAALVTDDARLAEIADAVAVPVLQPEGGSSRD